MYFWYRVRAPMAQIFSGGLGFQTVGFGLQWQKKFSGGLGFQIVGLGPAGV